MLQMAYRNLWRSKRRTLITLSSIVFATFLTAALRFLTYGTHSDTIARAVENGTGYLQLAAYGWIESGRRLDRALDMTPELTSKLHAMGLDDYSPRIEAGALVSKDRLSRFVMVTSFNPERESHVTVLNHKIIKGAFLPQNDESANVDSKGRTIYPAVIGYKMAKFLNADTGSHITLVTSQFDGSVGAIIVEVVGIIRADHTDVDENRVYLTLGGGKRLFAPGAGGEFPRYTSLAFPVADERDAGKKAKELEEAFATPATEGAPEDSNVFDPVVLDWKALNQDLVQYMILDQVGNEITAAFLLLIMAFGVMATVELSIHERTREFGILMAIGTKGNRIVAMVLLEVILMLIIGIAVGMILATALGFYYQYNPIVITGDMAEAAVELGSIAEIRPIVDLTEGYIAILALTIPSLLFSWMGARRIKKLQPVEVITTL